MKKTNKAKKQDKETPLEKLQFIHDEYIDLTSSIIESYKEKIDDILTDFVAPQSLVDKMAAEYDGLFTELAAADTGYIKNVDAHFELNEDFALEKFKQKIYDEEEDMDAEIKETLEAIGEEKITRHVYDHGYRVLKLESLADEIKFEKFLETELFPNYNDQIEFLKSI